MRGARAARQGLVAAAIKTEKHCVKANNEQLFGSDWSWQLP